MLELIDILWRWRLKILVPTVLAALAAVVASLPSFMPAKYDSKATFYAANPSATDRNAIFNTENGYTNYFGGSDDIDRLLSIATSAQFTDYMIAKFGLQQHYKLDDLYYTRLQWGNSFEAKKNDRDAIDIRIIDTDAALAKTMADATLWYIDSSYKRMILSARGQIVAALDSQLASLPVDAPIETVSKLKIARTQYALTNSADFTTLYITEQPSIALKKCAPVRWMIVAGAAIAALLLFSLIAVVLEKIKSL